MTKNKQEPRDNRGSRFERLHADEPSLKAVRKLLVKKFNRLDAAWRLFYDRWCALCTNWGVRKVTERITLASATLEVVVLPFAVRLQPFDTPESGGVYLTSLVPQYEVAENVNQTYVACILAACPTPRAAAPFVRALDRMHEMISQLERRLDIDEREDVATEDFEHLKAQLVAAGLTGEEDEDE